MKAECLYCDHSFEVEEAHEEQVGCDLLGRLVWWDGSCPNFIPQQESVDTHAKRTEGEQ